MRIVLFCENKYAIDILNPIQEHVTKQHLPHEILWYIHKPKIDSFPYADQVKWTNSIQEVYDFQPEAIYVPGNIVPYYLPGVKIQVFHGYAAEKKDHWIIRRYFDTYFTQGPYFTSHFEALAKKYGDFEVLETGWPKQDWIKANLHKYDADREKLLKESGKETLILYAPTFSPKLTSLPYIKEELGKLAKERNALVVMKFHPLTRQEWVDEYREWAANKKDVLFIDKGENVTKYQLMADTLISDTSSTIYEFLLLSRPVITLGTISKDREKLLKESGKETLILYAPTFSPKLTSLPYIKEELGKLAKERNALVVMKFHPLTRQEWVDEYREWAANKKDVLFIDKGENVTKYQLMADTLISDTSSTIYEFLLLSRPVITLGTISKDIYWENITEPGQLIAAYDHALTDPEAIAKRQWIVDNYDPYLDGNVCQRMLDGAEDYIRRHGVPKKRKLNLWRKYTSIKTFGRIKKG